MEYAIIGLPRKSLIFFLGIRLLPPLAGMMARLPNVYLIVFVNLPDNKLLLFCCQCGIHGQADTMPVIVLSVWHIALLPSKLPVIRHQVYRDVVDLCKYFIFPKKVIQSQAVFHFYYIQMIGVSF